MISQQESEAVFTICLLAAFADGNRSEEERNRISEIGRSLGVEHVATLTRKVVLKEATAAETATALSTEEGKRLAYEMAVYVCDADGGLTPGEQDFLHVLESSLGLQQAETSRVKQQGEAVAAAPVGPDAASLPIEPSDAEIDGMIMKYSILNGALELLPQSIATLAIIPLQMRMVYRVGLKHGVTLDQGHIKEFLATLGIGMTAQVVEGFARKLLGQLGKTIGGRGMGWALDTAAGAAVTFAATYALGHVAKTYYSGGRRLDMNQVRSAFNKLLADGKSLFPRHEQEIVARSQTLSVNDIAPMLKGR